MKPVIPSGLRASKKHPTLPEHHVIVHPTWASRRYVTTGSEDKAEPCCRSIWRGKIERRSERAEEGLILCDLRRRSWPFQSSFVSSDSFVNRPIHCGINDGISSSLSTTIPSVKKRQEVHSRWWSLCASFCRQKLDRARARRWRYASAFRFFSNET